MSGNNSKHKIRDFFLCQRKIGANFTLQTKIDKRQMEEFKTYVHLLLEKIHRQQKAVRSILWYITPTLIFLYVFLFFYFGVWFLPILTKKDRKVGAINGEEQIKFLGRWYPDLSVVDISDVQFKFNDVDADATRQDEPRLLYITVMKELIDDYEFRFELPFIYNSKVPGIDCQPLRENRTFIHSLLTTVIQLDLETNKLEVFNSHDFTEQIVVNASFTRENTSSTLNFIIRQKIGAPNYRLYMHSCSTFWPFYESKYDSTRRSVPDMLMSCFTYIAQACWIQFVRHALELACFLLLMKHLSCPRNRLNEESSLFVLLVCVWKISSFVFHSIYGFSSMLPTSLLLEVSLMFQYVAFGLLILTFVDTSPLIVDMEFRRSRRSMIIFMLFHIIEMSLLAHYSYALYRRINLIDAAVIVILFIWLNEIHLESNVLFQYQRRQLRPLSAKYVSIFLHTLFTMYLCVRSFDLVMVILPIDLQWLEYYISETITSLLFLLFVVIHPILRFEMVKIKSTIPSVFDYEDDKEAGVKSLSFIAKSFDEKDQCRDI